MITDKEIQQFWNRFDLIILSWNVVSILGFVFIPLAYVLKYWFGVKNIWLLNDTVDGDFGDPNELKKAGRLNKSKFANFWWWWFRNHSWNYIRKFNPEWNGGSAYEFQAVKTTLSNEQVNANRWTWCSKDGVHGMHYIAFRIFEGGRVYCRYSKATKNKEIIMGAGGDRYKLKIR